MKPAASRVASPGAYRAARDRWGPFPALFEQLARRTKAPILAIADRRVLALHPPVARALRSRATLVPIAGGEEAKRLAVLEQLLSAATSIPRGGLVLAIGGGSVGDVATVAAHLLKRGLALIHVPTTLVAAVDSSVGGKGAVHIGNHAGGDAGSTRLIKNAAGVFHYPIEGWICPELLASLPPRQLFEGGVEAYKMAACLDAEAWTRYRRRKPPLARLVRLVRDARALKESICAADPYEQGDRRRLLNFGHTFGHVFESLTGFEMSHGDAVCLGVCCALDIGRALGRTSEAVAREVEQGFGELWHEVHAQQTPREALAQVLAGVRREDLASLLAADKKVDARGQLRMALVTKTGQSGIFSVEPATWTRAWKANWAKGQRS